MRTFLNAWSAPVAVTCTFLGVGVIPGAWAQHPIFTPSGIVQRCYNEDPQGGMRRLPWGLPQPHVPRDCHLAEVPRIDERGNVWLGVVQVLSAGLGR